MVPVSDARGGKAGEMNVRQSGSAHEFGHAVGLSHPRCDNDADRCYGLMPDEKSSVMGYGDEEVAFGGPLAGKNQWVPG